MHSGSSPNGVRMWRRVVTSSLRTTAYTTVTMRGIFVVVIAVGVVAPHSLNSGWKMRMEAAKVNFALI